MLKTTQTAARRLGLTTIAVTAALLFSAARAHADSGPDALGDAVGDVSPDAPDPIDAAGDAIDAAGDAGTFHRRYNRAGISQARVLEMVMGVGPVKHCFRGHARPGSGGVQSRIENGRLRSPVRAVDGDRSRWLNRMRVTRNLPPIPWTRKTGIYPL